jgi:rhodanese-related sulfurtransferase
MKKILLISLCCFVLASCTKNKQFSSADDLVNSALSKVHVLEPAELQALMESDEIYTIIDVRQENEHYPGFIPGAVNIPRGVLEFQIGDEEFWNEVGLYVPEKEEKIILYCKKGQRSILAAQSLEMLGYKNVYVLDKGYKNWELTYPDLYEKDLSKLSGKSDDKPKKSGSC